jgi:hypothetical protein
MLVRRKYRRKYRRGTTIGQRRIAAWRLWDTALEEMYLFDPAPV